MGVFEYPLLALAAFVAGAINAVAGGGSLVSFPALVAAGYPSKVSNVTNTVALWPGYVGGSIGYAAQLKNQRRRIFVLTIPSVLGAIVGSAILLTTSEKAFDQIVPFLILFAAGLMAGQPRLSAFVAHHRPQGAEGKTPIELMAAVFVLAIYGAYFGAGLGIITLAVLGILLPDDLHRSNALKGLLSAIINAAAVVYFAIWGPVEWLPAAVMAVAALAGGYLGVGVARKISAPRLRMAVIAYAIVVAVVLFLR
ncbi:MAG: sulfite exporter TauE/SafE family protein [Dehalococcoidia bacterium]|nr:MAG: sulfite exporter TauE/SafE family protein [Dehalococcoidia bacterium]